MPKVRVAVPHQLDPDVVVNRAGEYIEKIIDDFQGDDLDVQWEGRTARFVFKSLDFPSKAKWQSRKVRSALQWTFPWPPYGVMGLGGNVNEWQETESDLTNNNPSSFRGLRGGGWFNFSNNLAASDRNDGSPTNEINIIYFRVASVPEPSSLLCCGLVALGLMCWKTAGKLTLYPFSLLPFILRRRRRRAILKMEVGL